MKTLLALPFLATVVLSQQPCLPSITTHPQLPSVYLYTEVNGNVALGMTPTVVNQTDWSVSVVNTAPNGDHLSIVVGSNFNLLTNSLELTYTASWNVTTSATVSLHMGQFVAWVGCAGNGMIHYQGATNDPSRQIWAMSAGHLSPIGEDELTGYNPKGAAGVEKNTGGGGWFDPLATRVATRTFGTTTNELANYTGSGFHIAFVTFSYYPDLNKGVGVDLNTGFDSPSLGWQRGYNPSVSIVDNRVAAPGALTRVLAIAPPLSTPIALQGILGVLGVDTSGYVATFVMSEAPSGNSGTTCFNTTPALFASFYLSGLRAQVFYVTPQGLEAGDAIDF
jgi:hypothetical protein